MAESARLDIGRVPGDLLDPSFGGMSSHPGERYTAAVELNEEQNVIRDQPSPRQHLNCEEVHSCKYCHMRPDEVFSGRRLFAFGCRSDSMPAENITDRLVCRRDGPWSCWG